MKKSLYVASYPPASVRQSIPADDWVPLLEGWVALTNAYLRLPETDFRGQTDDASSLVSFLSSFLRESDHASPATGQVTALQGLRRNAFLLVHRLFKIEGTPTRFLQWRFLLDLCRAFPRSEGLRKLIEDTWEKNAPAIEKSLQELKNELTRTLESKGSEIALEDLRDLSRFLFQSPDAGRFFMTGSDFLDSLANAYSSGPKGMQLPVLTVSYIGLLSLTVGPKANHPLLADHLYSLKSSAASQAFLADLVTNTPLLQKIKDNTSAGQGLRVRNIATSLDSLRQPGIARPRRPSRRRLDKGKTRVVEDEFDLSSSEPAHAHRMSLVTQVQDLFPDLGSAFVVKLLREYNNDVEQVTAHLLDDSLPPHLASADKTEQIQVEAVRTSSVAAPRSFIPERRNVFDNDAFDRLAVSASQLHLGHKDAEVGKAPAPSKAAILSALAAFDSDDDERDDTYDVEDVGGTVDSAVSGHVENDADLRDGNEAALFHAYASSPQTFGRDAETRRGRAREALRSETGMTDEAIEGWAIMVSRDPRRLRKLEMRYSTFTGRQLELPSSAYRGGATSGEDDSDVPPGGRGFGGAGAPRGPRRGRGGRGRGGSSVSGLLDDKNTQVSRQRKEANKSSRANHNRRDQRARKMARSGFAG